MLQTTLFVLKIFSAVLAGVFGAIGTVKDFRGEGGKVTKWGRVALVGIAASSLTAISTQIVEELIDQKSTQQTTARIERQIGNQQEILERMVAQGEQSQVILGTLERTLNKFSNISATAFIDLPESPELNGDFEQVLLAEYSRLLKAGAAYEGPLYGARTSGDGKIEVLGVKSDGLFYPQPDLANPFGWLLKDVSLKAAMYKVPKADTDVLATRWSGEGQPDLQISFEPDEVPALSYELERSKFYILQSNTSDSQHWDSNGAIVSLSDLIGTQIYFYLTASGGTGMKEPVEAVVREAVRNSVLTDVVLRIDEIDLWFSGNQLRKFEDVNGVTVWTATLPSTLPEIFERHVR